jgi:hypothetical protein
MITKMNSQHFVYYPLYEVLYFIALEIIVLYLSILHESLLNYVLPINVTNQDLCRLILYILWLMYDTDQKFVTINVISFKYGSSVL